MKKDVLIHVKGLQLMENEDVIELVVPGQYYFRNGSHYLRYEEMVDETDAPTVNYIKISKDNVEVRKHGVVNTQMIFDESKKSMTTYSTPLGMFNMGIAATKIEFEENEDNIKLKLDYALDINGERMADCYITIEAHSKDAVESIF